MIHDILLSRLTLEQSVYHQDAVLKPVEGLRSEIVSLSDFLVRDPVLWVRHCSAIVVAD
jgi:hypothetical protein